MKKILYITNSINGSGGLERVLSVKTAQLVEDFSYIIHISTLNESAVLPFYKFNSDVKFHSINTKPGKLLYFLSYLAGLRKIIKTIRPDIISVCDDGLKGFFLPRLLNIKNIPIVYERHISKDDVLMKEGYRNSIVKKIKIRLMDFLSNDFDAFVVLTDGNKKEWSNTKKILVIPNPLPFIPDENSSLLNKTVIAVGKQGYQKGYDRLLKSWKLIISRNPGWKLNIYGKKIPAQKLEELSKELNLQSSVVFFDPVKEIEKKYLESSVFVLSSRFEGFGMVIIEAMSCGLPVVSYDCKYGPSDIIKNNEDGFLIEDGCIELFAEKMELLMQNYDLRLKMGSKGKENTKKYEPEAIGKKWDQLFNQIKLK